MLSLRDNLLRHYHAITTVIKVEPYPWLEKLQNRQKIEADYDEILATDLQEKTRRNQLLIMNGARDWT